MQNNCVSFHTGSPFFFPAPSTPFPLLSFALGGRGKHLALQQLDETLQDKLDDLGRYLSTWAGSKPSVLIPGVPKSSHFNGVIKYMEHQL